MAVLKKFRSRLWSQSDSPAEQTRARPELVVALPRLECQYDLRPLTVAQVDECWRLDQRCFVDGEAYSKDTLEYLLTGPDSVSYRAVTHSNGLAGFVIGLVEPDHTGHITTIAVAPEHRRRRLASRLMDKVEDGLRRRDVRMVRLEVRSANGAAQQLYLSLGFTVTQRLPHYYSNGGDGLLMVKSLD